MTAPNPMILARQAQQRQAAIVEPDAKAKVVRPGMIDTEVTRIHDGVVKTKNLEPGMVVRPFVHGKARGGERIVGSTSKIEGGAEWTVTWDSPHVTQDYKAAYRWYCEALDGKPVTQIVRKPGFVAYHEGN